MLTNKHVVLSHNYPLEASIVVVSFVTPGLRTRTLKFGQANSRASWTFWVLCTLEFAKMARSFQGMRRRLTYFRSGATQVVIGLSELSFSQWHFFLQVIRSFIWSGNFTGLVNRSLVNNSCALLMMGAILPKLV